MAVKPTLESTLSYAASLEPGEWTDSIFHHLENQEYNAALLVCGEAVLDGLRRETDLSLDELKKRMQTCNKLEALEKMISGLARDARDAQRAHRAARYASRSTS